MKFGSSSSQEGQLLSGILGAIGGGGQKGKAPPPMTQPFPWGELPGYQKKKQQLQEQKQQQAPAEKAAEQTPKKKTKEKQVEEIFRGLFR